MAVIVLIGIAGCRWRILSLQSVSQFSSFLLRHTNDVRHDSGIDPEQVLPASRIGRVTNGLHLPRPRPSWPQQRVRCDTFKSQKNFTYFQQHFFLLLSFRYQINAKTELARRFRDKSPLENHHAEMAMCILDDVNLFRHLSSSQQKEIKEVGNLSVLRTKMSGPAFNLVSES